MRGISRLLRDTVTVATSGGVDDFGQPLPNASESVPARVMHSHTRSQTVDGEEFISTTQVATLHPIAVGDTLTIDGQERLVRAVKSAQPLRGGITLTEAHV